MGERRKGGADPLDVRIKGGGYINYADRCAVYQIYLRNKQNLRATMRQTKLDMDTVKRYIDQVQRQAEDEVLAERTEYSLAVHEEVKKMMDEKEHQFIKDVSEVKVKALELIKNKLETSGKRQSLKDLTSAVKVLHEITTGNKLPDEEEQRLNNKPKGHAMQQATKLLMMVQQNITVQQADNNQNFNTDEG